MKLKEIHRTSTFAWSPNAALPLLATGTVAGALDESFSNESQLEIWAPDFLDKDANDLGLHDSYPPKASVSDNARFNRLAWSQADASHPQGVIAAGLENGELALWDPAKILSGAGSSSLILRNTTHTGPVRGLDFNPIQGNLLASGGVASEVYIWDLKNPTTPYTPTPGSRSTKLDEITSLAWNQQVQHVLAGSSSTGYTVVWDLRGKREVVALAYGGGAGTLAGQGPGGAGMAVGGRRGMSDIAWHPDNATRLVTASEDDSSPIIMVWDLRNARAPEKILSGHDKGVLSLSWCKQDADLLLSCGKDNRALCWNPQTSEIIGQLPPSGNWAFQVDWCPRNPDVFAAAFFDGTIGIHSIQDTNNTPQATQPASQAQGGDIFDQSSFAPSTSSGGTISVKQPPKWLRTPVSASFGFGGKLVSVSNLPSAQGKPQSSVVHLRKVVTEDSLIERSTRLQAAIDANTLEAFAREQAENTARGATEEGWKALLSLFNADSRDELVTLLGFSKSEIAARVAEAVESLKASAESKSSLNDAEELPDRPHESVVSFAEPEANEESSDTEDDSLPPAASEKTPSELSAGLTSDSAVRTETDSQTTAPSLFGDDAPGTPHIDFFATVGVAQDDGGTHPVHVPHTNYGLDSSVAATMGSGPSSVTSETTARNAFKIYPSDDSDVDRLITKALVLGDFESAVSLCLSADRFADAILLAVRGGADLLEKTQKAYFARRSASQAYLRLFQSILTHDLADIVQNADLSEWREIFVVVCTFAKDKNEFSSLAEGLGKRLEDRYLYTKEQEGEQKAYPFKKNATLTYLAAARLERLVGIWEDELVEEEDGLVKGGGQTTTSYYSAHAHALQSFVEKVTVFRAATGYKDDALDQQSESYKLAALYDRYFEYADLLSAQGLVKEAVRFLELTPAGYKGSKSGVDLTSERKRFVQASTPGRAGPSSVASTSTSAAAGPSRIPPTTHGGYAPYTTPQAPSAYPYGPATTQPSAPYAPASSIHQPPQPSTSQPGPYGPGPGSYNRPPAGPGAPPSSFAQPPHLRQPPVGSIPIPAPPPPRSTGNGSAVHPGIGAPTYPTTTAPGPISHMQPPPPRAAPPPPPKRDTDGWNDPPALANRTPSALNLGPKPSAIVAPFPNATPSPGMSPIGSPYIAQGSATLPPPPRPGSVNRNPPPPPPPGRGPPGAGIPPPPRPGSGAAGPGVAPPSRITSPPMSGGPHHHLHQPPVHHSQPQSFGGPTGLPPPARQPTPSQYAPPPGAAPAMGGPGRVAPQGPHGVTPIPPPPGPPNPYAPPPPAPGVGGNQYAPPPQQLTSPGAQPQSGPYGPPPGAAMRGPPGPVGGAIPPPPQRPASQAGGPRQGPPRSGSAAPSASGPSKSQAAAPKYPPGDRSHIPDYALPAYEILSDQLNRLKQTTPPNQKRLVDDLERRLNPLFDALNCETISRPVVDQLVVLAQAMAAHDRPLASSLHVTLLTTGSQTDDIGMWMSGVKQLIMRL